MRYRPFVLIACLGGTLLGLWKFNDQTGEDKHEPIMSQLVSNPSEDNVPHDRRSADDRAETVWKRPAAEQVRWLQPAEVCDPSGSGPDGVGNSQDDPWQFWYEDPSGRSFRRLNIYVDNIYQDEHGRVDQQRSLQGWSHDRLLDMRYEGVWANPHTGVVLVHPYAQNNRHYAVAVSYRVPQSGRYNINAELTDAAVVKFRLHDGIRWRVERALGGAAGRVLSRGGPIGDRLGPESQRITIRAVQLNQGDLVRLVIDPGRWWGTDETRIDSFHIRRVKEIP